MSDGDRAPRKKLVRHPATVPPPQRASGVPPPQRGVGLVPRGAPPVEPPTLHVSRTPVTRGVGQVPNPRRLTPAREGHTEVLDLFAVFPDLPRPPRPAGRQPPRVRRLRLSRRK